MEIIPPGYKFNPTDQELIWHYLYKKVNGKPLPCNAIIDCDIYGGDSSWRKMFDDREVETLYFFTKLRNWSTQKNGCSSRVVRATKFGTWRCQSDMKIYAGKKHVGSKRAFSFIEKKKEEEPKKKGSRRTNGWTMHEYRLDGCLVHQKEHNSSDYGYVVSRISRPRCMRKDEGESISSQIASEQDAPFPEELNQDNNKGKLISSQIECEQDAPFPEELNQDSNKVEGTEVLPGYSIEVDINDEWLSCFLEDTDLNNLSFLWQ
ncbi:NAC domain-containing protein 79-like [Neltuma alba]|uniref:NAC domain-containing protein 79-like n=1 Tax=Neltuma alba TaxID=207710 RepID=UPI0010A2C3FD|nr:NAC domain-containing protein 79-like [Prosopis alba]